jgi:heme/copper-type cytochrome/quinol oxidase subunit 3
MLKRAALGIGALLFATLGTRELWGAVQFSRIMLSQGHPGNSPGVGAVSVSIVGLETVILWMAGIAVNRAVAGAARRTGGATRRLHRAHLALAFGFAAVTIATLAALAFLPGSMSGTALLAGALAIGAAFAAQLLALSGALALLARRPAA